MRAPFGGAGVGGGGDIEFTRLTQRQERDHIRGRGAVCAAFAIVLAACGGGSGRRSAATTPFVFPTAAIQDELNRLVATSGAPGVILGASVRGGPVTVLTAGKADPRSGRPMVPDDVFYAASLTKTFTGALVLTLVDEGKVRLDDPINSYGLGFPNGDRITVRELLTHMSGIPPLGGDSGAAGPYATDFQQLVLADLHRRFTPADIVAHVKDRPLLFAPGTATSYSNINTILAGQLAERVTGEPLVEALHQRLIDPLGLTSTRYTASETAARSPIPGVFHLPGNATELNTADFDGTSLLTAIGAAGAISSDAADLVTWGRALLRDRKISPRTRDVALSIGKGGTGLGVLGFANGFCLFDDGGCGEGANFRAVGGSGSVPGTDSLVLYDRPTDTVLVLADNADPTDGRDFAAATVLNLIGGAEHLVDARSGTADAAARAERWWQWETDIPAAQSPVTDKTGQNCAVNQPGDVWFLAATNGGAASRSCAVPRGRPLFVPVAMSLCAPQADRPAEQEVANCHNSLLVTSASVRLDGHEVALESISTDQFAISPVNRNAFFRESPMTVVAEGDWAEISPLSRGQHKLELHGAVAGSVTIDVTYSLTAR